MNKQKQQKINNLEEEITTLKGKLRYQERTAKEGFFGSSTSSAKIPVKANNQKEHQRNRGGFIPTCDHGVPDNVSYENYMYYRKRMIEMDH